MKRVAVLGSTGSVGKQVLDILRRFPDQYRVTALASYGHSERIFREQIQEFAPSYVVLYDQKKAHEFLEALPNIQLYSGAEGLVHIATHHDVDVVVAVASGIASLPAIIEAIKAKKQIIIANKEILVVAGELVSSLATQHGVTLFPVDSEHNALYQCLEGGDPSYVSRLILTASGGPLWNKSDEELRNVTVQEVLNHSVWNMGKKITVDSSTLMNKALEIIEAYWLFGITHADIQAVIHPQCIVHGMVEFIDGTVLSLMNPPSMLFPIQYAFTSPQRSSAPQLGLDFSSPWHLDFFPINEQRFPSIVMAQEVLRTKGSMSCFFNAVNDVLVERFLNGEIPWCDILGKIQHLMSEHRAYPCHSLDDILLVDQEARALARKA